MKAHIVSSASIYYHVINDISKLKDGFTVSSNMLVTCPGVPFLCFIPIMIRPIFHDLARIRYIFFISFQSEVCLCLLYIACAANKITACR